MKTMKWLIKREMWENKGMLLWAPAAVAALIALMALAAIFSGHNVNFHPDGDPMNVGSITIKGHAQVEMIATMAQAYMVGAMPVLMLLGMLVFFYCLGALHDERRDRSLLFWKSLPVSDATTVLSKVLMALVVAPLITLAIGFVLSLALLVMGCLVLLVYGTNVFGTLLMTPDLYLTPLRLVGLLPVYILWALPTVGWLLMVSSMARSKVFLWAVGTPLVTAGLLLWAEKMMHFGFNAGWFVTRVVERLLLGAAPGSWFLFEWDTMGFKHEAHNMAQADTIFNASWATLGSINLWLGVAAGTAMIATAIWMRRRREEG
jgi:ABC-2 type transport system permease protein